MCLFLKLRYGGGGLGIIGVPDDRFKSHAALGGAVGCPVDLYLAGGGEGFQYLVLCQPSDVRSSRVHSGQNFKSF